MRLSATETQLNNNKDIKFCGNNGPKFISDKSFDWMKNINGAQQRAVMGATAIVLQPPIDYYNPNADEKTRNFSTMKTIVKVVVGTLVGVGVRYAGIKYAKSLTKTPERFEKLIEKVKDIKIKEKLKDIMKKPHKKEIFENNLGTLMGVIGVLLANFTIDMPLAKFAIEKMSQKLNLSVDKPKEDKK